MRTPRSRRAGLATVAISAGLTIAGWATAVPWATASVGVGVTAATLTPPGGSVHPGEQVAINGFVVADTGTEPVSVAVAVHRLATGRSLTPPADWITLTEPHTELKAHEEKVVQVTLSVPPGARPGFYVTDLVASGYDPSRPGNLKVQAAAATQVQFRVLGGATQGFPDRTEKIAAGAIIAALAAPVVFMASRRRRRKDRLSTAPVQAGQSRNDG